MATIIKVSGELVEVEPNNGSDFTLAELYEHVGTDIVEFLFFRKHLAIFCEEGKMRDKPPNVRATAEALMLGWHPIPGDHLVGDVLFCLRNEVK